MCHCVTFWAFRIHSATLDSGVLENQEVLQKLRQLREQRGWKVGLSLSGVGQSKTLETLDRERP